MSISYILFIFLFPIFSRAQTSGIVAAGTTVAADENSSPWLSPSGDFAFGFKQLQENDQFLFSIWFNKIPDQTVVWYPSSTSPVVPCGSSIRVDPEIGLVLLDPQRKELWRTQGIDSETDQGFMNDSGNFILKGRAGSWLWESFKVYADTILPGQEIIPGLGLNSRLSENSFSGGRFFLRFRGDGNLALVVFSALENYGRGVVYYSSNTADAQNSSNSGSFAVFDENGFIYVRLNNNQTKQLSPGPGLVASDSYFRATLEFDGVFILYSHPRSFSGSPKWTTVWSVPDNICLDLNHPSSTGACGYNSICSLQNRRALCNCSAGFDLVNPDDKFGDCKPNFNPTCDGNEQSNLQILEDVRVDFPGSDYKYMNTVTEKMCRESCLRDCLCAVAIYINTECVLKKLPLSNGSRNDTINSKVFIKSSSRSTSTNSFTKEEKRWTAAQSAFLGSSLFVNFAFLGVIVLGFYIIHRRRKAKILPNVAAMEPNLRCFTFNELTQATGEFKEEIGRGSYGVVYKGELASSTFVAVKKLNRLAQEKEFRAEVNTIGKTNHKNLVRLLGFCDEGLNRLLVYEYMSNGTLASFLFFQEKPSWNMRKQIAVGIAKGLVYLHEECSNQIIHCDIKPQNILLDDYYNVRISDFGLAKLLDTSQSKVSLTNVRGTRGYVAPEWFRSSPITAKVDVYSFGVLLLEIISCKKCIEQVKIPEEEYWGVPLTDLAWDCFQAQRLDKFVGKDSEALKDEMMLERFMMVGIWCIQENSSSRPTMKKVNQMLEGIVDVEIPPCPSPFSNSV